jgi:hypothetical protein
MLWMVDNYMSESVSSPERFIDTLQDHDFFGDEGLVSGERPKFSVVAKTYCVLMGLSKQDFDTACPRMKGGISVSEMTRSFKSLRNVIGVMKNRPVLARAAGNGTGKCKRACMLQSKRSNTTKWHGVLTAASAIVESSSAEEMQASGAAQREEFHSHEEEGVGKRDPAGDVLEQSNVRE